MKMLLAATSEHRLTWQFMQSTTDRPAALSKTRLGMTRQKTPAAMRCPCSARIVAYSLRRLSVLDFLKYRDRRLIGRGRICGLISQNS